MQSHNSSEPRHPARAEANTVDQGDTKEGEIGINLRSGIQGRVRCEVIQPKKGRRPEKVVHDYGWERNLILDKGLDRICANSTAQSVLAGAQAGTGTTPLKALLDGTFAQSGTTVTRSSGVGTFAAGDVNKRIRFGTGQQAKITAFTNSTTITVDRSATVAASPLTTFNTNQLGLATFVVGTTTLSSEPGAQLTTYNAANGDTKHKKTWIFPAEVSARNYTEIAIGSASHNTNVVSRILLASTAAVGVGQQLRVTYEVTLSDLGPITPTERTIAITGWPYTYNILSIISTASYFDVRFTADHHYVAAGKVNVAGALPTRTTITSIASDPSTFTVTSATAHGRTAGESIEIAGASVGAYNGTWTIATAPTATTLTVTSAANPGAATGGTVRLSTPGTWYNGEWTVASVPEADTIRITSVINPVSAGADGTGFNNLKADVMHPTYGYREIGSGLGLSQQIALLYEAANIRGFIARQSDVASFTPSAFPWVITTTPAAGTFANPTTGSQASYVNGTGVRVNTMTWPLDRANFTDIRMILIYIQNDIPDRRELGLYVLFHERQRKDSGYQLVLTLTRTVEQILA